MKLYCEDGGGDKPPLLLIAGMASDAVSWVCQADPLGQAFRLLRFDNRGVGRSPIPEGPYPIEAMVADTVELLDDLGVARVHVVGHSLGGAIAQQLALNHPERVERLVLACTVAHFSGRSLPVVESWTDCVRRTSDPGEQGRALFPWLYTERFLSHPGNLEACIEALRNHPYPLNAVGMAGQVGAIRSHDTRGRLGELRCPTLVMGAQEDLLVSSAACQDLAERIPGARLEMLADTAHSCMLETPDLFTQTVMRFLNV